MLTRTNTLVPAWIPRFSASLTAAFMGAVLAGAPAWVLVVLLPDFVARAANRRSLSPVTWLASRVFAPQLPPTTRRRHTEWAPKLFASRIGLGAVIATLAAFALAPASAVGPALAGVMLVLCGLEALAGFCVACRAYTWLGRLNLVRSCPGGVCDVLVDEAE